MTGTLVANKTYDGTTTASVSGGTLVGVVGGDSVTLGQSGTFSQSNVGTGLVVTATNSISGSSSANYSLTQPTGLLADITAKALTVTGAAVANKVYDATNAATFTAGSLSGVVSGDTVTLTQAGTFSQSSVGTNLVVTATDTISGTAAANYTLTQPNGLTANITAKALTVSGSSAANKTYDGTTTANISGGSLVGVVGADSASLTLSQAGTFSQSSVGTSLVVTAADTISGSAAGNYTLTQPTGLRADITPAPLTISVAADSKVYGASMTSNGLIYNTIGIAITAIGYNVTGLIHGTSDTVSNVTLTTAGGLVTAPVNYGASYSVTAAMATGSGLANYNISYQTGVIIITPKVLNVTVDSKTMSYGSSTLPNLTYSLSGLVNGDAAAVTLSTPATAYSGLAGSASSVGTYPISATAVNNPNYSLNYTAGVLSVMPVSLTIRAGDQTTTYGSPLVLSQNYVSATGLVNGDYVTSATILSNASQTGQVGSNAQTVSGLINAGTYTGNLLVSNASGVGLSNYNISYQSGSLLVNKAPLTVAAINDGKFITQTDAVGYATNCGNVCQGGYAGVVISGFLNADNATNGAVNVSSLAVTRTDLGNDSVGTHTGVLVPSNVTSSNYSIHYQNGNYTVSPANQLVVKFGLTSSVYGSAPNYNVVSASYLDSHGNILANIPASISGTTVRLDDQLGTTAEFNLTPNASISSGAGKVNVGSYIISNQNTNGVAVSGQTISGINFSNGLVVLGMLNVTPKVINFNDLGVSGVTKVYDGSTYMTNLALVTSPGAFVSGDNVAAVATGTFHSKNVGNGLGYTVGLTFTGSDAANYVISGGAVYVTGVNGPANGVITPLASVTYTGASGGNWSNPSNWTTTGTNVTGAIPDLSNVNTVILPSGSQVVYDNAVAGPVTSSVINNGSLTVSVSLPTILSMPISGSGTLSIANTGTVTLSGSNSYTGGTVINGAATLIAASNSAIGNGVVSSRGTAINPASFGTTSSVVLPALTINGGATQILTGISTVGNQSYSDLLLAQTQSGITTLASTNANISLLGKVDSVTDKTQSLALNAGNANIVIGDNMGSVARLKQLTATASKIYVLADILTSETQTFNGDVLIGDVSYLSKTPTTGFLYQSNYIPYFQYHSGNQVSGVEYLDANPIYIRTLISEDPVITFNGALNDLVPNTHTLLLAAIAPALPANNAAAINAAANINFMAAVGTTSPLYSLNAQTVLNSTVANSTDSYLGSISVTGGVTTFSTQYYRANMLAAQSAPLATAVTFSVYDPAASVNYLLPMQTLANSGIGFTPNQMNLQSVGSGYQLLINGASNYPQLQNINGVNNWGGRFTQGNALGYVAPSAIQLLDYASFIQRGASRDAGKQESLIHGAVVEVGDSQLDGDSVDCDSLRKQGNKQLPPECRTNKI